MSISTVNEEMLRLMKESGSYTIVILDNCQNHFSPLISASILAADFFLKLQFISIFR